MSRRSGPACGRWLRLSLAALALLVGLTVASGGFAQGAQSDAGPVFRVVIGGAIDPGALVLLQHAITTAENQNAAALIVQIDTPGGLLSSTRDMANAISESQVPVVGYVGPSGASATSAGAFILLSTDIAVMNLGTNLGASSPVAGDGSDIKGTLGKKVMNDSRAFMRSIASRKGRNPEVAESFVSDAVSLTAREAQEAGVIDLTVPDESELLSALSGRTFSFHGDTRSLELVGAQVQSVEPRLFDRLLGIVGQPQVAHLLLTLGMLAIYVEIMSPGLAFPGVLGTIAVVLGLVGVQALPVNVGFLLLLILGMGLMIAEYFVAGFGVLGIGGAIAFTLGGLKLFDLPMTAEYRDTALAVSMAVSGAILLTTFLISRTFARRDNRAGRLIGMTGEAMVTFDQSGYVLVNDQRWPAVTVEPLSHGDAIAVTGLDHDGRLVVKRRLN